MIKKIFCIWLVIIPVVSVCQPEKAIKFTAGSGADMVVTPQKYKRSWSFKDVSFYTGEQLPVYITPPVFAGCNYIRNINRRFSFEAGFQMTHRQIFTQRSTINLDGKIVNTGLRFNTKSFPVMMGYSCPCRKVGWSFKAGFVYEFLYAFSNTFYLSGPASLERKGTARVIEVTRGEYRMFHIDGREASVWPVVQVECLFGKKKNQSVSVQAKKQMLGRYQLHIWGYDKTNDQRTGGYFNSIMKFTSLQVGYNYYLKL